MEENADKLGRKLDLVIQLLNRKVEVQQECFKKQK